MTRDRSLFAALFLGGCFVATVVIGLAYGPQTLATPAPAATSTPVSLTATPALSLESQITILLLGVDSLQAPRPRLVMCWALTFLPGTQEYYLLGFAPDLSVYLPGDAHPYDLADVFDSDSPTARGHRLVQMAVESISPALAVQAEATYDRTQLSTAVDQLGGVALGQQLLDGALVTSQLDRLGAASTAAQLQWEGDLLTALLRRDWASPEVRLVFSLGQWLYPSPDWFLALAQQYPVSSEARFFVTTFPGAAP